MKKLISLSLVSTLLMVMTLLSVSASATDKNLILDGDFEADYDTSFPNVQTEYWEFYQTTSLGGWTVANTFPDSANYLPTLEVWDTLWGYSAANETQNIELDGHDPTTISQTPATVAGACYELSYAWSPRPTCDDNQMKVYVDNVEVAYHSASGVDNLTTQWTWEKLYFKAVNSSTTIAFAEVGPADELGMLLDAVSLKECPLLRVGIDFKPKRSSNRINLKSKRKVRVAILTTDDFDAYDVDPDTCVFANANPLRWKMKDVDNDSDEDMLFHFKIRELDLSKKSTEATLEAETYEGIQIIGTDSVNIVSKDKSPSKKNKKSKKKKKNKKIKKCK
jgi:Protein of unknown function (DUF642)